MLPLLLFNDFDSMLLSSLKYSINYLNKVKRKRLDSNIENINSMIFIRCYYKISKEIVVQIKKPGKSLSIWQRSTIASKSSDIN